MIAFKPAQGFAFVTEHERARFDTSRASFLWLESPSRPHLVSVRIACRAHRTKDHDDFLFSARIVIETGLRELVAAGGITSR